MVAPELGADMRRREFISLLRDTVAAGAAAWPLVAHAQQHVRHIGVVFGGAQTDPEYHARIAVFRQELQKPAGPTAATFGSTFALGPTPK